MRDCRTPPFDVMVCGAGPAGIGAAVTAGRAGARTLLIEATGCLGGLIGNAFLGSFCDSPGGPVFDDFVRRMGAMDAAQWRVDTQRYRAPGRLRFHPETARAVLAEMIAEAGVDVLFCTLAQQLRLADKRVTGVEVATKSGVRHLAAEVVIDCTADGDLAAGAGVPFDQGDPEDGRIQVCNFTWQMENVPPDLFAPLPESTDELAERFAEANRNGAIQPPDALFAQSRDTFPFDRSTRMLRATHWELRGIDPTDAVQVSRALLQCQRAALQIVRFCRQELPGCAQCRVGRFPAALGTRESRRIRGRYTLTRDDVLGGRKFPDGITRAWFWIDFHDPPPGTTLPYDLDYVKANQPPPEDAYEIPYRCLLPVNVDQLLVAGRCISCDRSALASLRVMPTCMFLGTAAGLAAAQAASMRCAPAELDGAVLKRQLLGTTP